VLVGSRRGYPPRSLADRMTRDIAAGVATVGGGEFGFDDQFLARCAARMRGWRGHKSQSWSGPRDAATVRRLR
jgi:hypothetical protein